MRIALAFAAVAAATLTSAPAAHAGCTDDYVAAERHYKLRSPESVKFQNMELTVKLNEIQPDATYLAGGAASIGLAEAGHVVVFVECVN